jgi:UDP-galactopyranose mutase
LPPAAQLWTVEPSTMDFNWIGRRVPTPDVERIVMGALTDDVAQVGATAQFWYPWRGGIEALARALAGRVEDVELGREVRRIDVHRRVVELTDGDDVEFRELIFTLPLAYLARWISDLPGDVAAACERLRYQGILNVNLGIDRAAIADRHWVYFYEEPFPFHRLSFPTNFSPGNAPPGKSSISMEIAYTPDSTPNIDAVVRAAVDALRLARIVDDRDAIELVHVEAIAPAYVIYDLAHGAAVDTIVGWLRSVGIEPAGRFGEWQYFNMDHAMRSGRVAAESVLARRRTAGALR